MKLIMEFYKLCLLQSFIVHKLEFVKDDKIVLEVLIQEAKKYAEENYYCRFVNSFTRCFEYN